MYVIYGIQNIDIFMGENGSALIVLHSYLCIFINYSVSESDKMTDSQYVCIYWVILVVKSRANVFFLLCTMLENVTFFMAMCCHLDAQNILQPPLWAGVPQ